MNKYPKLFIGPMSKNIVDSICGFENESIGLIPSRRQIEFDGGYVNNWTTKEFIDYVKSSNQKVIVQRDHGGPHQGKVIDDGIDSLKQDCSSGFDLIHIDPWKKCYDLHEGIVETVSLIKQCLAFNKNCKFEIGTEQAIREFSVPEVDKIFTDVKSLLGHDFNSVVYGVIQGGTSILGTKNTGVFNTTRFEEMIQVCKKHELLSKEHNGDYLTNEELKTRFDLGLDSINIAPEFGVIETKTILEEIINNEDEILFQEFFDLCYRSGKWKKWINNDFYLTELKKHVIIRVSGHYVFSDPKLMQIKNNFTNLETKIKQNLDNRIKEILCLIK